MRITKQAQIKFGKINNDFGEIIHCEPIDGQIWSTDTAYAIATALQPTSKYTTISNNHPKIQMVFDRFANDTYKTMTPTVTDKGSFIGNEKVNHKYILAFEALDGCIEYQENQTVKKAPIKVLQNNKFIGVIMPMLA